MLTLYIIQVFFELCIFSLSMIVIIVYFKRSFFFNYNVIPFNVRKYQDMTSINGMCEFSIVDIATCITIQIINLYSLY